MPIQVYAEFNSENGTAINQTLELEFVIKNSDFVIITNTTHGKDVSNLRQVSFHEDFILNMSLSYDPDYSTYNGSKLLMANSSVI